MINCRMVKVTTTASHMREVGSGKVTRLIPTDRLLEKFEGLEGHPALQLKPDTSGDISDFLGVVLQPRATQLPLTNEK